MNSLQCVGCLYSWVDLQQAGAQIAASLPSKVPLDSQQDVVTDLFKAAKSLGLNSVRLFGHGDGNFQLQTEAGVTVLMQQKPN